MSSDPRLVPVEPFVPTTSGARLAAVRERISPRWRPEPTPLASLAIHGGVAALWLCLFANAFAAGGALAWASGIAYIVYDTVLLAFVGWRLSIAAPPPAPDDAPPPTVAVIVAARDEARVLPAMLASLLGQVPPPAAIIVADDGSTDDTADLLVRRYGFVRPEVGGWAASATVPSLHWARLPHGGKARALNAALDAPFARCRTDIVVTVDADTRVASGAIGAMSRAFTDRRLVAATGVLTPVCAATRSGRVLAWFQTYEYLRNFLSRAAWAGVDSLLLISGAFAGFRRDAVVAVGGFDPDCLAEDYELIHRLMRHAALHRLGWRTGIVAGARADTEAPGTVSAFLRQRRRWFGGFLETQYWYRGMVGDGRRFGNIGRWMLPIKAIDTLQPVFGLTALGILAVAVVRGRLDVLVPASAWIAAKIAIDLGFHVWSVHRYRAWLGAPTRATFGQALVAALVEPFSFQVLRHTGAALGWATFLGGRREWGRQERRAVDDGSA